MMKVSRIRVWGHQKLGSWRTMLYTLTILAATSLVDRAAGRQGSLSPPPPPPPPGPCIPRCSIHGSCVGTTTRTCSCQPGWHGNDCNTEDPCHTNPCRNQGTCNADGDPSSTPTNSYRCSCLAGFHGTDCETNACLPNPCQNGAPISLP